MPMLLALGLLACDVREQAEDWSAWYDSGEVFDVSEPIAFTDQNYSLPAVDGVVSISDLQDDVIETATAGEIVYAPEDALSDDADCDTSTDSSLPMTVQGVVTLHPRFYFKTQGCDRSSDEKYYGSYFIQDDTGGLFVLGDSKVAHFDVGDRVVMTVRATKTNYDLPMIYAHDIVSVERDYSAIYYEVVEGRSLGASDMALVKRVTGVVTREADTFGQFQLEDASGSKHLVSLDSEINRRKWAPEVGQTVQVTGPVLLSYSEYQIVIMNVGQLEVLDG